MQETLSPLPLGDSHIRSRSNEAISANAISDGSQSYSANGSLTQLNGE